MALPRLNPGFIETAKTTAGHRAAQAVAQRMTPQVVRDVQRIMQAANFIGGALDVSTGIDALDNLAGLARSPEDRPTPLLGGLTPKAALEQMRQLREARLARKNLWYIRVTDPNPPVNNYFRAGDAFAPPMFDLFALDVAYGPSTLTGEKVAIGSAVLDKLTGSEAVEMTVTTMDDERGTLKRWFEAKANQAARPDGTFGLPGEYCVNIEVVHAIASPDVPNSQRAYRSHLRMRPGSIQYDLSRRDQAIQELQMAFSQFDTFAGVI